jgi:hypothetical protein
MIFPWNDASGPETSERSMIVAGAISLNSRIEVIHEDAI